MEQSPSWKATDHLISPETESHGLLPRSQQPVTGTYSKPNKSSSRTFIPFSEINFNIIYGYIFKVDSSFQVFWRKLSVHYERLFKNIFYFQFNFSAKLSDS
jgi:hypothetical protein